jgi:DNA invertase Pin-like site-specific DNA recombinase
MTLCDLYLRLSDGRTENGSFTDREKSLRGKAKVLGWTVHRVVIENDLMNGSKSASAFKRRKIGTTPDGKPIMRVWRPGFRSILDDLAAGRVQAVLAEDLDRTMRDPRDAEDLIDIVRERGAYADSLSGSLRFTAGGTDAEVMMARIAVTVAAKASADTARRVAGGRQRQAGNGQWGGGRRPYGFRPVANPSGNHRNTTLVIDEAEADEIRKAADQVLSEVALKAAARDMIERGVTTVTGTRWTAETLRDVLLRPLNAGIVQYQGEETEVRLSGDPILHEDTWRAVVAKLTDPARSTPGRAPTWLGTNLYRCVCGSVMEIQRGTTRAASYRCAHEGGSGDAHVRRNAEQLDNYISALIIARLSRPDAIDLLTPPTPTADTKALRRKVSAMRELLDEFARDRADGLITREQMLTGTRRSKQKLAEAEAQLAAGTDVSPLAPIVGAADVAAKWASLSLGQRRGICFKLLDVRILPISRKGRGFDEGAVAISWRT